MAEPLVSVLTPVFNGERFLDAAVSSVLAQTYENWELLLVDDGSSDGSWSRIEGWARSDARIRALAHAGRVNRGVSATRNLALRHASGKYVALLDCDDEWLSDKLERQVRIFEDNPDVVIAYGRAVSIDAGGLELANNPQGIDFPPVCGTGLPSNQQDVIEGMIRDTVWLPTLTVMMKAAEVREVGGFDEGLAASEDHLLFTLLASRGQVFFTEEVLARYRVHAASCTQSTPWLYSMCGYYERLYEQLPAVYRSLIISAKGEFITSRLVGRRLEQPARGEGVGAAVTGYLRDGRVPLTMKMAFIVRLAGAILVKAPRRAVGSWIRAWSCRVDSRKR